jgi:hypothetical protein
MITRWDAYEEAGNSWAPMTPAPQEGLLSGQGSPLSYFQLPVQARAPAVLSTAYQSGPVLPALQYDAGPAELAEERARKAARRRETRHAAKQGQARVTELEAENQAHKARIAELEAERKADKARIAELETEARANRARVTERDVAFNAAMNSIFETAQAMFNYQNGRA